MSNKPDPSKPSGGATLDPYTEFLGLAAGPRPPHLYQLLDLELFCPHPERIQHAVRAQFRKIKPYEEHPDRSVRERIQDVMSHIATARVVLTDPIKRQEYDELLAQRLKVDRDQMLQSRTAARPPEYRIRVLAGSARAGLKLELLPDREFIIGSRAGCDLMLPGYRVRESAVRLRDMGGDWQLKCLSAKDVLLVNDQRCTDARLLDNGDEIEVGGYRLLYERLDEPAPDARTLPPALSLIIREGPSIPEAQFYAVGRASILIGSDATALWRLYSEGVSVHHARVQADAALWEIRDLQSDTGTWINGERVTQAILSNRDMVKIGAFQVQVGLRR